MNITENKDLPSAQNDQNDSNTDNNNDSDIIN